MPYPPLSPGAVAEIVCRYRRGESTPQIARSLHVANSTVVAVLDREGVERRKRGEVEVEECERIREGRTG